MSLDLTSYRMLSQKNNSSGGRPASRGSQGSPVGLRSRGGSSDFNFDDDSKSPGRARAFSFGQIVKVATGIQKAANTMRRRSSVRLASLVGEGELDTLNPEEVQLAHVESPDLNKDIKNICIALKLNAVGLRAFEACLPFAVYGRDLKLIRCISGLHGSRGELEFDLRSRCNPLALKHDLVRDLKPIVKEAEDETKCALDIIQASEAAGADVIVVGTKRNGYNPGHTVDLLVKYSMAPVLVVRPNGIAYAETGRYLVFIDGSTINFCAFRFILRLVPRGTVVPFILGRNEKHVNLCEEIASTTEHSCAVAEPFQVFRNEELTLGGNICEVASEENIDVIVVGSTNKGQAELGSLEGFLVYHAPSNVLVYKNQYSLNTELGARGRERSASYSSSRGSLGSQG